METQNAPGTLSEWLLQHDAGPEKDADVRWKELRAAALDLYPALPVGTLRSVLMAELERLAPSQYDERSQPRGLRAQAYRELLGDGIAEAIERAREFKYDLEELEQPWHRAYVARLLRDAVAEWPAAAPAAAQQRNRRALKQWMNTTFNLLKSMESKGQVLDQVLEDAGAKDLKEVAMTLAAQFNVDRRRRGEYQRALELANERKRSGAVSEASRTWHARAALDAAAAQEDASPQ